MAKYILSVEDSNGREHPIGEFSDNYELRRWLEQNPDALDEFDSEE